MRKRATSSATRKKSVRKPAKKQAKKTAKKRMGASEQFKSESRFYNGDDIRCPFDAVISEVTSERMTDGEEKCVIYLDGHEKGIVLNLVNGQQLGEDLGDDMTQWPGNEIHVYTERTRNPTTGKTCPGVRVCRADALDDDDDEYDDEYDDDDLD